jgi:hypothetical protein
VTQLIPSQTTRNKDQEMEPNRAIFFSMYQELISFTTAVFRIRIHRIHVFFGLPDPDSLVRGMDPGPALDPDPSIIKQK